MSRRNRLVKLVHAGATCYKFLRTQTTHEDQESDAICLIRFILVCRYAIVCDFSETRLDVKVPQG